MDPTRREFVALGSTGLGAAWLSLRLPAVREAAAEAATAMAAGDGFTTLEPEEALELEAIAARILPEDDGTPGAREAGVIHFIDRAFGSFAADSLAGVREGLIALTETVRSGYLEVERFSALSPARQDELLRGIEDGEFFGLLRFLTVAGMFAMPRHGGNRDKAGWALLGFEDRYAWQPPFGHYDAGEHDA